MNEIFSVYFIVVVLAAFPAFSQGWNMVWSDEFDYEGLPSPEKWTYREGGWGWGNNELQYYTVSRIENAEVADGILTITARKENFEGKNYTSACVKTEGRAAWCYGKIEVRAKFPPGRGNWPGIWMLPENSPYGGWPQCGEIDIAEYVGWKPDGLGGAIHVGAYYGGNCKNARIDLESTEEEFHNWGIEWNSDSIVWYVDNTFFFKYADHSSVETWPFDNPFHLLIQLAVGGSYGGAQGVDDSIFPNQFLIDYVRIYEWNESVRTQSVSMCKFDTELVSVAKKNDHTTVVSAPSFDNLSIMIIEPNGRIVGIHHARSGECVINHATLGAGVYIMRISGHGTEFARRLIIE